MLNRMVTLHRPHSRIPVHRLPSLTRTMSRSSTLRFLPSFRILRSQRGQHRPNTYKWRPRITAVSRTVGHRMAHNRFLSRRNITSFRTTRLANRFTTQRSGQRRFRGFIVQQEGRQVNTPRHTTVHLNRTRSNRLPHGGAGTQVPNDTRNGRAQNR